MRLLLPPLLVALLLAALGALHALHPATRSVMHPGGLPLGKVALALALGLILLVGARVQFARSGAEIMTFATPRRLVTTGLFRLSRNPMYLGFTLVLVAGALAVNTWCALLAPLAFFLAAHLWYVPYEERAAAEALGPDYEAYRVRTRRWL